MNAVVQELEQHKQRLLQGKHVNHPPNKEYEACLMAWTPCGEELWRYSTPKKCGLSDGLGELSEEAQRCIAWVLAERGFSVSLSAGSGCGCFAYEAMGSGIYSLTQSIGVINDKSGQITPGVAVDIIDAAQFVAKECF